VETIEQLRQVNDAAVVVVNQEGAITFVNGPFEDLFQWRSDQIVGKPLTTIIPVNLRDAHQLGFSRFLTTEKPSVLQTPLLLKAVSRDGRVFEAEHYIVAERIDGSWNFAATIKPVNPAPEAS
jgi:PAS domain S-box-containing protein